MYLMMKWTQKDGLEFSESSNPEVVSQFPKHLPYHWLVYRSHGKLQIAIK